MHKVIRHLNFEFAKDLKFILKTYYFESVILILTGLQRRCLSAKWAGIIGLLEAAGKTLAWCLKTQK